LKEHSLTICPDYWTDLYKKISYLGVSVTLVDYMSCPALPCPQGRAGQKKIFDLFSGQGRARQNRAKGRAGRKKVPCDGL
jgi:hypothetical protein